MPTIFRPLSAPIRRWRIACLATWLPVAGGLRAEVSFNHEVRPILSDRCFHCHGPDAENQKSEFRLDTAEKALADLGGYVGIAPGVPAKSEMHKRIHSTDPDDMMPPPDSHRSLNAQEKEILDQWIREGAKFDKHWAFKPLPERVAVPSAGDGWARNGIDRFVAAKFAEQGLAPAEESTREKWLRRVSFDLTGLPPTLAEIDAFLADARDGAYERVVDRLLDTDAHAERMTSEWLDVARYSDTYGYQRDDPRLVWPWRDWVVGAFRTNMPYDEFVTLQLAGDLLPGATAGQILPTVFNRLHSHKKEGGSDLEEFRVEYVADRTQTFGTAFLGLTMECSRCHDHKYDPITMRDYYSLSAFFANIDEAGLLSYFSDSVPTPAMPLASPEQEEKLAAAEVVIAGAEQSLVEAEKAAENEFATWLAARRAEVGWPGMTAHLAFEKLENGKLYNEVRPEAPATSSTQNAIVDGRIGNAILLTGDDAVVVPKVGRHKRETPFSVSLWLKTPELAPRMTVFHRSRGAVDVASLGYEFLLLDGKPTASLIHFWPGNAIRVQVPKPLTAGRWHHVVITYDGSRRAAGLGIAVDGERVEVDIVRDGLTRQISKWRGGQEDVRIGERFRDRGFVGGQVDEFRMFDRELTGAETRHLFDGAYLQRLLATPHGELTDDEGAELREYFLATASDPVRLAREELKEARAGWNRIMDGIPAISIMREMPTPRPAYILTRGAYSERGEEVTAATPAGLPEMAPDLPRNRLGLARWLTAPENPLTARVAVNRYWQMVFGDGIVRTPEDFGSQGARPTHPELLDWLARDFVGHGWDLRHLLRQMTLSASYRQSTVVRPEMRERDPENLYLARSKAGRLPAEMIRDNALAVSGLLVRKVGGAPVKPYEVGVSFKPTRVDAGEGLYRRSLYTWWKRTAPAPVMMTLNSSKREVCRVKREVTASPLQSLVMLNGPGFVEASRVMAEDLVRRHGENTETMLGEAFRVLTSREADAAELEIITNLFAEQLREFEADPEKAKKFLQTGKAPTKGDVPPGRHAATAVLVNALMNFDECVTRR